MRRCLHHLELLLVGLLSAAPAVAQDRVPENQLSVDVGLLQGGISYASRLGEGRFSLGGGLWGGWEPWNSFRGNIYEPMGAELFVRMHPSREVHLEMGPSVLRYRWADDCSECTGTFYGLRAAAMVGRGIFSLGPTARLGRTTGSPAGAETGIIWGIQARLLFSWGE